MSLATATVQLWRGDGVAARSVPLPEPGPGELLVAVRLATVCGSDLHTAARRRPNPCPCVLGHEAVGDVVAGTAVDVDGGPVRPGDRIVWSVTVSCRRCDRCRRGWTAKCRAVRKVGHEPFNAVWTLSGCYATHIVLPAGAHVVRVPESLPDPVAAPAACATATVVAAADAAGPLAGRRVLVSGAGMLGVTATALAAEQGASEVVVTDVDRGRLRLAAAFGATRTVPAGGTVRLGEYDVVLELSGAAGGVATGLDHLDVGGVLVLAGSVTPGPAVPLDPERVVRRWLTVTGVHNYEPGHLVGAVALLTRTTARPWADLVAEPRPLAELADVLHAGINGSGRVLRLAVRP